LKTIETTDNDKKINSKIVKDNFMAILL